MITFKRIELNNIVYYKKAELDLDYEGITVIRGRNYNVRKGLRRSNGSGKSLLVSAMATLLNFGSPTANTAKRGASRDLMEDGSKLLLEVQSQDSKYVFVKSQVGKSIKFGVMQDGKDLKPRTAAIAQDEIKNIVGFTENEFFSLVYLDSRRPYLLQIGSPSQRLDFFTKLFRLDEYDTVRAYIRTAQKQLHDHRIRKETLEEELESINLDDNVTELQKQQEKLSAKVQSLREAIAEQQEARQEIDLLLSHLPTKEKIDRLRTELSITNPQQISVRIKNLQDAIKVRSRYEEYLREKAKAEKQQETNTEILTAQIHHVNRYIVDSKDVQATFDALCQEQDQLSLKLKELEAEYRSQYKQARKLKREKPKTISSIDSLNNRLDKQRATTISYETDIKHIKFHLSTGKSSCSVCGGPLSKEDAQERYESMRRKRASSIKETKKIEQAIKQAQDYAKFIEAKDRLQSLRNQIEKVKEELKDTITPEAKSGIQEWIKAHNTLSQDDNIPEWTEEIPKFKIAELQAELDLVQELKSLYSVYSSVSETLKKSRKRWRGQNLRTAKDNVTHKIKEYSTRLTKAEEKLPHIEAQLLAHEQDSKRIRVLKKNIAKLDKLVKEAEVLDVLLEAYSAKGLKTLVAKRIADLIQQNMNNYAGLLFPEKFQFKFQIDAGQFDILVRRRAGGKSRISDVRFLSGAESRAFTLLCLISIMPLIPKARRSNIVILDEMEANLDASGENLFIHQFLPTLNEIIPHILVVTPKDTSYPNSRIFTAAKKGDETKLIKESAQ